jgi:hypothetical protein
MNLEQQDSDKETLADRISEALSGIFYLAFKVMFYLFAFYYIGKLLWHVVSQ